jgi:hypothetical protein
MDTTDCVSFVFSFLFIQIRKRIIIFCRYIVKVYHHSMSFQIEKRIIFLFASF